MLTEETIKELKAQHKRLWHFSTAELADDADDFDIVVRAPSPAEFKCFRDGISDDEKVRSQVVDAFVADCVVYPDRPTFAGILRLFPGIVSPISVKLQEMAGSTRKLAGKAL